MLCVDSDIRTRQGQNNVHFITDGRGDVGEFDNGNDFFPRLDVGKVLLYPCLNWAEYVGLTLHFLAISEEVLQYLSRRFRASCFLVAGLS